MKTNIFNKKIILYSVIVILAFMPFAIRFFHSRQAAENYRKIEVAKQESILKRYEKEVSQLINDNNWDEHIVPASMNEVPFPQDIVFLSLMAISPDSTKIVIAGGDTNQKIYIAPFPPKSKNDFNLVADIPNSLIVNAIRWNNFDPNIVSFLSVERGKTSIGKIDSDLPSQKNDLDVSLYTVNITDGQLKKIYTSDKKVSEKFVAGGADAYRLSLCWEAADKILLLDGRKIFRIENGQAVPVLEIDLPSLDCKMLSMKDDVVTILCSQFMFKKKKDEKTKIDNTVSKTQTRRTAPCQQPYIVTVNLKTKETIMEKFLNPIEHVHLFSCNETGTKLVTNWFDYDGQWRLLVLDKEKQNERTILEIPRRGNLGLSIYGMTPNGQYAFGMIDNKNFIKSLDIMSDRKTLRRWEGLGIVTLN